MGVHELTRSFWAATVAALVAFCLVPFVYGQELPTVLLANVRIVHFPSATLGEDRTMLVMLPVDSSRTDSSESAMKFAR